MLNIVKTVNPSEIQCEKTRKYYSHRKPTRFLSPFKAEGRTFILRRFVPLHEHARSRGLFATEETRPARDAYRAHLNFRGSALTPIIVRTTLANMGPGCRGPPAAGALGLPWRLSSVAKRQRHRVFGEGGGLSFPAQNGFSEASAFFYERRNRNTFAIFHTGSPTIWVGWFHEIQNHKKTRPLVFPAFAPRPAPARLRPATTLLEQLRRL